MPQAIALDGTVRQFQRLIGQKFLTGEKYGSYNNEQILLGLGIEIGNVMETVRKDKRREESKLPGQLVRVYGWWNVFADRCGIDLQEVLWWKYPAACTYCLKDKDCMCGTEHPHVPNKELVLRGLRADRTKEPVSLSGHQMLHKRLYGWQNDRLVPFQIAAHLAEEFGEVSLELLDGDKESLGDELADIGSWIFALANRFGYQMSDLVAGQLTKLLEPQNV